MRLFFALWPPRETAQALAQWARGLPGRATAVEKIHLTLAFLGDVDREEAVRAARGVSAASFELPIEVAEYWRRTEIVWVGPAETPPALKDLAKQLRAERRRFAAHVTLLRKAAPPGALPPLPAVRWPVREFVLVSSSYTSYETLERFPLR